MSHMAWSDLKETLRRIPDEHIKITIAPGLGGPLYTFGRRRFEFDVLDAINSMTLEDIKTINQEINALPQSGTSPDQGP